LISDGGNKHSGNMCKALAIGADCLMVGRLVAGCDESPGKPLLKDGKFVKMFRGMAGCNFVFYLVMANISKQNRGGKD
jgi:IMP dehydrogenase